MADPQETEHAREYIRLQTRRAWITPELTVTPVDVAEENPGAGGDGSGRS